MASCLLTPSNTGQRSRRSGNGGADFGHCIVASFGMYGGRIPKVPVKRIIFVLGVALLLCVALLMARRHLKPPRVVVSPAKVTLPADGAQHKVADFRLSNGGRIDMSQVVV